MILWCDDDNDDTYDNCINNNCHSTYLWKLLYMSIIIYWKYETGHLRSNIVCEINCNRLIWCKKLKHKCLILISSHMGTLRLSPNLAYWITFKNVFRILPFLFHIVHLASGLSKDYCLTAVTHSVQSCITGVARDYLSFLIEKRLFLHLKDAYSI